METGLAACRFAHFLSLMLGFGASLYVEAFAPRVLRAGLVARLRPLALTLALAALASGGLELALEAPAMSGDPADFLRPPAWADIAFDTAFGQVWTPRLGLLLALPIVIAIGRRGGGALALALWAATLASLALVGHAAMQTGQAGWIGWAHRASDGLHLLCSGCWLGGLAGYLASLSFSRREDSRAAALRAMTRFSNAGHVAVILLFASGVADMFMTTGALPWPLLSPYRGLLFFKVLIAATMTCVAIFTRYVIVPNLRSGDRWPPALALACAGNLVLGATAVALVSCLGLLDPA